MKRITNILVLILIALFLATPVYAGVFDSIKSLWSGSALTAVALILSGILALGAVSYYTDIASKILISTGALLSSIGLSLADRKLTKEEILDAKAKWTDLKNTIKELKNAKR